MKKVFVSTALLFGLSCFTSLAQPDPTYSNFGKLWSTNHWITKAAPIAGQPTNQIRLEPGGVTISHQQDPRLYMDFLGYTYTPGPIVYPPYSGWLRVQNIPSNVPYFEFSTNVHILGNLTISGGITAVTNILWATNTVWSTNAFYYPTNSQTAAAVDLSKAYGDLQVDGSVPVGLRIDDTTKVVDTYQTAVVLVRNTSGVATNITVADARITGTPWVTNRTVVTLFYHGLAGDIWTNATCLPLW